MSSIPRVTRAADAADDVLPSWLMHSREFAVVFADEHSTVSFANEQFAAVLGYESAQSLLGMQLRQSCLVQAADWTAWQSGHEHQFRLRGADGAVISLSGEVQKCLDSTGRLCIQCIFFPSPAIGENGQLLEHAARMEAVAGLSSGIAHDFNNLLTVLVGNLYLLGEELRENESAFARIKAARDTALRGSDLTRQLLNYARTQDTDDAETSPASVVNKLRPLLEKLVGSGIDLQIDAPAEAQTVSANRAQLESAIVNLVINARDAIDGRGSIVVSVRETKERSPGPQQLIVSVSDDGPGMSAELQQRVFEPFFTTKGEGSGTGLGLSMVRWFAESADGAVEIESRPGAGATVSILLPQAGTQTGDTTCSRTIPLSVLPSGEERIAILVKDSEVRAMTQQTLSVLGYDVKHIESADPASEGMAMQQFDLAVIDADSREELLSLVSALRDSVQDKVLALTAMAVPELAEEQQLRKPFFSHRTRGQRPPNY